MAVLHSAKQQVFVPACVVNIITFIDDNMISGYKIVKTSKFQISTDFIMTVQ